MPKIVIVKGPETGRTIAIGDEPLVIGRGAGAGLVLDDGRVSRRHAIIQRDGKGGWEIRDLRSSNGTLLNNEPVHDTAPLESGDRVTIGRVTLCFDPLNTTAVRLHAKEAGRGETSIAVDRLPVGDQARLLGLQIGQGHDIDIEDPLVRLKIVYHYADVMRNCYELDDVVGHVLEAVATILRPDRSAVLLRDARTGALAPAGSRTKADDSDTTRGAPQDEGSASGGGSSEGPASAGAPPLGGPLHISTTILDRAVKEGRPIISLNAAADDRFEGADSVVVEHIGSAVACPLVARGETLGVLYLDTVSRQQLFGEPELELITGIANQAAMAIANVERHRTLLADNEARMNLAVARRIHDHLVPDLSMDNGVAAAYGWNRACAQVGGDHFGFFENTRRGPLFTIGDSTGHGVGAALLMSTARAYLIGAMALSSPSLEELMTTLNKLMEPDTGEGLFVTFLLARIDPEGPRLRTCIAGHEPPLLYRPSTDGFIEVPPGSAPLGLVEGSEYKENEPIDLQPGDRICLFTDGVAEQRSSAGGEFGIEGLKRAIRKSAAQPPKDAVATIAKILDDYRGRIDQEDDFTLVLIEVK